MHAVLLTLIALGGGADAYATGRITQSSAEIYQASAGADCQTCGAGHGRGHHGLFSDGHMGGWFGHMPQTCYSPRYGCYYGNNRHMHRYPAFHGTFYRRPYNYRNLFDYPWHAEMHEPTSLFSYNVIGNENDNGNYQTIPPGIPTPTLDSARRAMPHPVSAAAYPRDPTNPRANPAATLRR